MSRINVNAEKRKLDDNLRINSLKKKEDENKKRNQIMQDMLVQRIITTNERKLEKTLAKEKYNKSNYQFEEPVMSRNFSKIEILKAKSLIEKETNSFDQSRKSLGPEIAYRKP